MACAVPSNQNRIKVCVRIRPQCKPTETGRATKDCIFSDGDALAVTPTTDMRGIILSRPFVAKNTFKDFDAVVDGSDSQQLAYDTCAAGIIDTCLQAGVDGTILAYGITGAGKSHSVWGPRSLYESEAEWSALVRAKTSRELPETAGILPRAIHQIFDVLVAKQEEGVRSHVEVSMMQLYQENLYDMCVSGPKANRVAAPAREGSESVCLGTTSTSMPTTVLPFREDSKGRPVIPGLVVTDVSSPQQALKLLRTAIMSRFTAATALNDTSSRSHALVQITIKQTSPDGSDPSKVNTVQSVLTVVDLAGSERLKRVKLNAGNTKEAAAINKSIFCLGTVVHALAEKQVAGAGAGHIPYRNSVLTRLLRPSLDGSTNTTILTCISCSSEDADETYGTLHFATRALHVAIKPKQRNKLEAAAEASADIKPLVAFEAEPEPVLVSPVTTEPSLPLPSAITTGTAPTRRAPVLQLDVDSEPMTPEEADVATVARKPLGYLTQTGSAKVSSMKAFLAQVKGCTATATPELGEENDAVSVPVEKESAEFNNTLIALRRAALLRKHTLSRLQEQVDGLLTIR